MLENAFGPVILGLVTAVFWGVADFSGGLASRRTEAYGVAMIAHGAGFLILAAIAVLSAEPWPAGRDLGWGAAGGCVAAIGLLALYRGLAKGSMGITAAITAVLGAALPVTVGALTQGLPHKLQLFGFVLAMIGVWFLVRKEPAGARPAGLGLAIVAGVGLGGFMIMMAQISPGAFWWPLAAARGASSVLTWAMAAATRRPWRPSRRVLPLIATAGSLDVLGMAAYVMAAQIGRLDTAAVLASLSPAGTVLMAWILLKEQVTRTQWLGILAALLAVPLIAV